MKQWKTFVYKKNIMKIAGKYVFHTVFHLNTALVNCVAVAARSHKKPAKIYLASFWFTFARHLARLRRRRGAYAPTNNTASHDNHKKITSWVSFDFPWCQWGSVPSGPSGLGSSAKTSVLLKIVEMVQNIQYNQLFMVTITVVVVSASPKRFLAWQM